MQKEPPHPNDAMTSTTPDAPDALDTEPATQNEQQPQIFTDSHLEQQHVVATATSLVLAVSYLGLNEPNTWQGWEWEAGSELLSNPDQCIRAHGLALMLDDLTHQADLCVAIIEQLRDALQHTTRGPLPKRYEDVALAPARTFFIPTQSA